MIIKQQKPGALCSVVCLSCTNK